MSKPGGIHPQAARTLYSLINANTPLPVSTSSGVCYSLRSAPGDTPVLDHNFTNIVRELHRIINLQAFDQERLVVQEVGVQAQLLLVALGRRLQ